jgi:hypothetical protein
LNIKKAHISGQLWPDYCGTRPTARIIIVNVEITVVDVAAAALSSSDPSVLDKPIHFKSTLNSSTLAKCTLFSAGRYTTSAGRNADDVFAYRAHSNVWFSHPRNYGKGSRQWYAGIGGDGWTRGIGS